MKSPRTKLVGELMGLDIGQVRTGVARMNTIAKIPQALQESLNIVDDIDSLITTYNPSAIVVGLPRGLDGQETEQTRITRETIDRIRGQVRDRMPVFIIDEAGTTKEAELRAQTNESVDSVAAGIILQTLVDELAHGKIEDYEI